MLIEELKTLREGILTLELEPLRAVICGEEVPDDFPHELVYKCLVAGIRYHDGFAIELRGKSLHQSLERAFNARDIMSNRIPEMEKPEGIPYGFWHPNVPSQETLRQLLKAHPTLLMRYKCLAVDGKQLEERAIPSETLALLYAPLPRDLQTVDKDILILIAAFTGKIYRYVRLRRPRPINVGMQCIVRGINHNTFFAKWCFEKPELAVLQKSVHARFIMNDDLMWLSNNRSFAKEDVPRIIWYPQTANRTTYLELLRLIPELKQLVAQALVVFDSPDQFLRLEPEITPEIYAEIMSEACSDVFEEFLHQRLSEEEEGELAEWMELPHDVHDVAPYDHLVSKEMKPWFGKALKEVTLVNVGFENREVYEPDTRDARDLMRFMSAFPMQPRDHYREGRGARMRA
ncbi:hypothetical protein FPHYL_5411 [Fusarium phyllophilum]|uniref:Uncharacterized protein n=1 Tax=Fusarium phyllophilum TaxID=47803 RepID=A0A8H5NDU6_9HYPO|nr:hypothetical protein FPHYL_5411 [Fusarium phyllophilum]